MCNVQYNFECNTAVGKIEKKIVNVSHVTAFINISVRSWDFLFGFHPSSVCESLLIPAVWVDILDDKF